ncbi:hypothetical protein MTR67_047049 [Solanum verrucosum]|uniref:Uncharacterized protein n=1 Tax=Solanum verrucosum TaxID=315347 RepID=A0AAF0UXR3_SOLVR|nr:hypothetical protein MTR67_047049 [Solanum verrucosum]
MKDQFHELNFREFMDELTKQEQSFFQKKAAENNNEKSYVTEIFGELYFKENNGEYSFIKNFFPPMPKKSSSENNANYKASISQAEFEKINFSEKLPNGDDIVVNYVTDEMQKGIISFFFFSFCKYVLVR